MPLFTVVWWPCRWPLFAVMAFSLASVPLLIWLSPGALTLPVHISHDGLIGIAEIRLLHCPLNNSSGRCFQPGAGISGAILINHKLIHHVCHGGGLLIQGRAGCGGLRDQGGILLGDLLQLVQGEVDLVHPQ